MFHKAIVKLTSLYLGIIMLISLAFSISLYQVSVRELDRGLRNQSASIMSGPRFRLLFDDPNQIDISRESQFNEARYNLFVNLMLVNITILIAGGFLSYYLARRTLQPIEEAHRAQSRFTADASHELRTPLAVMQTEIEVALMDPNLTLEDSKKQLASNLEELAKLTSLSEGLLRLARLEDNNIEKSIINLNDTVKSAIERASQSAAKKSIILKYKENKTMQVEADQASLEEAILILIDNAIKYSPAKSTVEIKLSKSQNSAVLSVKDKGIGISDADLEHIFERFYRADSARSKNFGQGYGLGLAIAKGIIDLHQGEININSKLGNGSTFTIKLPILD